MSQMWLVLHRFVWGSRAPIAIMSRGGEAFRRWALLGEGWVLCERVNVGLAQWVRPHESGFIHFSRELDSSRRAKSQPVLSCSLTSL